MVSKRIVGVNRICSILGISKGTYYNSVEPNDRLLKKYKELEKYVEKIIKKYSYYGIRRIKTVLEKEYDIVIGKDTLGKLLILWGLSMPRKIKTKKRSMIEKILIKLGSKANLLAQCKIERPFQAISTDITKLKYKNGSCYLCVYKDVVGQMVYGWHVSEYMDVSLVLKAYSMCLRKLKFMLTKLPKKIIIHQDQGTQYTSYAYIGEVLKNFRLSFSNKATPTDNAGQESFFGRLKTELRHEILEQKSVKAVEKLVKKRIKVYNEDRVHTSIGYQTPEEYTYYYLKKDLTL